MRRPLMERLDSLPLVARVVVLTYQRQAAAHFRRNRTLIVVATVAFSPLLVIPKLTLVPWLSVLDPGLPVMARMGGFIVGTALVGGWIHVHSPFIPQGAPVMRAGLRFRLLTVSLARIATIAWLPWIVCVIGLLGLDLGESIKVVGIVFTQVLSFTVASPILKGSGLSIAKPSCWKRRVPSPVWICVGVSLRISSLSLLSRALFGLLMGALWSLISRGIPSAGTAMFAVLLGFGAVMMLAYGITGPLVDLRARVAPVLLTGIYSGRVDDLVHAVSCFAIAFAMLVGCAIAHLCFGSEADFACAVGAMLFTLLRAARALRWMVLDWISKRHRRRNAFEHEIF